MIFDLVLLVAGVVVLVAAADRMVMATAGLAYRWGISQVIVGALIIGFGTSLPEMLVSLLALDQPNGLDLAVGNAIGSNIANISLILGFSFALFPISGQARIIRREGALMLVALIAMAGFLWNSEFSIIEAATLLLGLLVAGLLVVRWSAADPASLAREEPADDRTTRRLVLIAVVSLAALVAGARAMVLGAERIALELGLAEGVVGLTILALGTSLPELGTAWASSRRGHGDLVLGNVLGSNIFNALGVTGVAGVFGAGSLAADFRPDLVIMVVVAVAAGLFTWTGDRVRRIEAVLLLLAYPLAVALTL